MFDDEVKQCVQWISFPGIGEMVGGSQREERLDVSRPYRSNVYRRGRTVVVLRVT